MTTPARVLIIAVFAAALTAILGGCSTNRACPAIGYINTATFDVRGSDPAALRLCIEDVCAASNDLAPSDLPLTLATPSDLAATAASSSPPSPLAPFTVRKTDAATFAYSSYSTKARSLEVAALDASGIVIGTTTAKLNWKRVGGTEQCGGPSVAHATLTFG